MDKVYKAIIFDLYGVLYTGKAKMPVDRTVVDIVLSLKTNYKIAVCSNIAPTALDQILIKHDLADLFDVVVPSGLVGVSKPQPEIFQYTLDKLRVSAREAVFIDDQQQNVLGAQQLGITGIVYHDPQTLQQELDSLLL